MERSEPSLVPEWYKGASSSASGTSNFNPHSGSSHSDEINSGFSWRSRLSMSFCDQDDPHSSSFTERTSSSFHRSASSNGSMGWEKELPSRAYSSFGRSHRDRNRDRENDLDICDRDRPLLVDGGFSNYPDSLVTNKLEKESLRRSHSMVAGNGDSWLKRPAHDSSNNVSPGGSIITGISKSSFERDFPSLGAEEKHVESDVTRVASPVLSTAIHNLPVTASTIIGVDGWTSVLAEVPPIVGGNGLMVSSALRTSPALTMASSTSTGLNMAETVAQAPARVRTTSQLPNDSQKIEELHRLQILKLRPVTPSIPKNSGLNSAEKSKTKLARTAEFSASKVGRQSSSQLVIHDVRSAVISDVYKISQPGNFQVLNRERDSLSPTGKDSPKPTNVSRVTATHSAVRPVSIPNPKGPMNPKLKVDGKVGALSPSSHAEKKLPSQAQNRNDFFNSLRKKTSCGQHPNANDGSNSDASSFILEKVGEFAVDSAPANKENVMFSSNASFHCPVKNGNCSPGGCDAFEEPEKLAPNEEEATFLRSLGWDENAGVEALTSEEIESFLSEYKMRRPAAKLKI